MIQDKKTLIKSLLEAGVHFGHQKRRWNPKMKPYIFGEKNNTYIIDLQQTVEALIVACRFLNKVAQEGGYILFVGTKKQAQDILKGEAQRCGMFYVDQRWLGGMLTNFQTIRKSINRLEALEIMREDGTFAKLAKKEVSKLTKEMNKLKKNLDGVRKMDRLPKALFVIDAKKEDIAIHEANVLSIPVVALADTNSDPDVIDYVVPGNDDAIKSIKLIAALAADAVSEGRNKFLQLLEKEESLVQDKLSQEPKMEFTSDDEKVEKFMDKREEKMEEEAKKKQPASKTKPVKKKKEKAA
ncbi:MAG: 30S ribosomal protein S2 [Candidatus Omnitrophota bacterium]